MKYLHALSLITLGFFSMSSSCSKEEDAKPAALSLPLTVDFTNSQANGKTSITVSGIDFVGTGVDNSTFGFGQGTLSCVSPTNAAMHGTNSIQLAWGPVFNCLVADVSKLPAIQKITVTLFNNGGTNTQMSLCDGSQVIGNVHAATGANTTMTLNVGGKTASKFYIYSGESSIYSIVFE